MQLSKAIAACWRLSHWMLGCVMCYQRGAEMCVSLHGRLFYDNFF
jgi:hypothetical protein